MLDVDTRRYFAYGSNMDRQQMRGRCPGAVLLGTARLPGYRFIINRAGVASVVSMGCPMRYWGFSGILLQLMKVHWMTMRGLVRGGTIRPYCP